MSSELDQVLSYHARTKHHLHRYAASAGYLDWATQPDPFRRYEGAPLTLLDVPPMALHPSYDELFLSAIEAQPFNRETLSRLLYNSLALSAWKEFGENRWSLRVNPSSGNLHPTEGYLLFGDELSHYAPHEHGLELRRRTAGLPEGMALVGLTSIHWRESWKYGERAFRYCHHDVGHAIAAVTLSATMLGWQVRMVDVTDELLGRLLGVSGQQGPEAEHPDVLLLLTPRGALADISLPELEALAEGALLGDPNRLSPEHEAWPAIDEVAAATVRSSVGLPRSPHSEQTSQLTAERSLSAQQIVRQRRSAVRFDGQTSITRDAFFRLLERLSPAVNPLVFGTLPWTPAIHLALFVHRVDGLDPGLYFLPRRAEVLEAIRSETKSEYLWRRVPEAPETVPLHELQVADAGQAARVISCHQEIASAGAFSLGMIAEFEPNLLAHGPWFYKRLFWEAGAVGQMLYLEAEAAGVRGTGIGCFFDDVMHDLLGLKSNRFQSLYHFTVGGPVEDTRLRTAPAYGNRAS